MSMLPIQLHFRCYRTDLAQVITSSNCFVRADATETEDFMVTLPCMELATIGGLFGTAKEALNLLGCGQFGSSIDNRSVLRLRIAAAAVTAMG